MVSASDILNAKILIVDDQQANVSLLERMLHRAGYACVASTMNPREVCELHRANRYDLILLDLQMPDMDGFEVMEGLKEIEIGSYLSVLAVTAQPGHKLRALEGGAKDFLSKPFDLAEVLARVHNLLEVRLLHDAASSYARTLESLALHDPLTGLANRRLLAERMRIALAHSGLHKSAMAVVCLDLDGFKQINDTLGHGAGDTLLQMVAQRLVTAVRDEDTVARVGGDEFTVALWHVTSADDAAMVAAKVIDVVSQPYGIEGHTVSITTSVGVGLYPAHGWDSATLMESADLALYEAKRAGKNAFRVSTRTGLSAAAHAQHDRRAADTTVPGASDTTKANQ